MNNKTFIEHLYKYKYMIIVSVLLFFEYIFFRNVIFNYALIGDIGDGKLTNLMTEHWWRVLEGKEGLREVPFFHPDKNAIGYSDLLLGYSIPYVIFRLIGVNMYASYKWTLIIIHLFGAVTMFILLNKYVKCNLIWSFFGTIAYCYSDAFSMNLCHTQLNALSYLPLLCMLLCGFIKHFNDNVKRNVYAYLFILWFALITYTSWYIACFCGVFTLFFLMVSLVFLLIKGKLTLVIKRGIEYLRRIGIHAAGYIVWLIISFVPFGVIYFPTFNNSGGYQYDICKMYLPEPIDIINVGDNNLILGWFIKYLNLTERGLSRENLQGYSLIVLLSFLLFFCVWKKKKKENTDLIVILFGSIVFSIVSVMKLSSNGISVWMFIYNILPIVRSIRAVARFWLWISFPLIVLTSYLGNSVFESNKHKVVLSAVLLFIVFLSNIDVEGIQSEWDEKTELVFINNIKSPPEDCEVFYTVLSEKNKNYIQYHLNPQENDRIKTFSYEIASWYDKKTINGYSGHNPLDYGEVGRIDSKQYEGAVYKWITDYNLNNIYAYDITANEWYSLKERFDSVIEEVFSPADRKYSLCCGLLEDQSGEYMWSQGTMTCVIKNSTIKNSGLRIKLRTPVDYYLKQQPDVNAVVDIYVNKKLVDSIVLQDGYTEAVVPLKDHSSDIYEIQLKTDCYFVPKDIGLGEDLSKLYLGVVYIGD